MLSRNDDFDDRRLTQAMHQVDLLRFFFPSFFISNLLQAFLEDGRKSLSVEFAQDGHFLHRYRARFVVDAIDAMVQVRVSYKSNTFPKNARRHPVRS